MLFVLDLEAGGLPFLFPVVHKPSTSGGPHLTLASAQSSGSHLATLPPWPRSLGFLNLTSCFVVAPLTSMTSFSLSWPWTVAVDPQ